MLISISGINTSIIIYILNMPINVFGNSNNNSNDNNKIDTSRFVQKANLSNNYLEENINQVIDLKNQYRIINNPNPINNKDVIN